MQKWTDAEGIEFQNSDICFGREFNPGTGKIDIAKISIRGRFPEKGWGYLEESDEMAVIISGNGYIETKDGEREELKTGDVVHIGATERFCWGGDMDMIVPCGPSFEPSKHHLEEIS